MKKVYLLHGWEGAPERDFFPWLKLELESDRCEVIAPSFPNPDEPRIETWVPFLQSLIANPDEDTSIVAHSMGCQATLRYLENLPEGMIIGRVVLVAPVIDQITNPGGSEEVEIRDSWLSVPIDANKVKRSVKKLVGLFSDNDPFIPLSSSKVFKDLYGGEAIIEHNKGHWCDDDRVGPVPEILNAIIN
ncbi:MAG: alpha/beta fold hydrolase [Patescibacteria group bacterium]